VRLQPNGGVRITKVGVCTAEEVLASPYGSATLSSLIFSIFDDKLTA